MPAPEAPLEDTPDGRKPSGPGWFVLNLAEAAGRRIAGHGTWTETEPPERYPHYGFGVHVVMPGESSAVYHEESNQEDFLVLSGECIAIVEEREIRLRQWDHLHCPPGTRHIIVGAGDGPCAVLMVGARLPDDTIVYPASEVAARHGASAAETTSLGREAYAGYPESEPVRFTWPPA
jgi:uncharacterized cupin superfamily protein